MQLSVKVKESVHVWVPFLVSGVGWLSEDGAVSAARRCHAGLA